MVGFEEGPRRAHQGRFWASILGIGILLFRVDDTTTSLLRCLDIIPPRHDIFDTRRGGDFFSFLHGQKMRSRRNTRKGRVMRGIKTNHANATWLAIFSEPLGHAYPFSRVRKRNPVEIGPKKVIKTLKPASKSDVGGLSSRCCDAEHYSSQRFGRHHVLASPGDLPEAWSSFTTLEPLTSRVAVAAYAAFSCG